MNRTAFVSGYLQKRAGWTGDALQTAGHTIYDATKFGLKNVGGMMLAAPVVAGAAGGAIASKLTSPSHQDLKNLENTILLAELRKSESELNREQDAMQSQNKSNVTEGQNAKEIRALV